jgi:peptidoglycan/xylan/chitin deacetylase (PgdA/CDA1 family)
MRRVMALLFSLTFLMLPARAAQSRKYVALTFDDGPSGRYTRTLLDGLYDRGAKATFLLCGYRLKDYPKEARRILELGHEIGLHGYSHDPMDKMSCRQLEKELNDTLALLPSGCRPVFLRPPGGKYSSTVKDVSKAMGLALLNWSVDPRDWATRDAEAITTMVIDSVRDGDVILLHDMCDCSVDAALAIIDKLTKQGFCFVTVSELARRKGITVKPGVVYSRFTDAD